MKIVAYTRVSTSEQGKSGLGLSAQLEAIKRFCEFSGHELIAHYEEVISGKYFLSDRPVLKRAFANAEKEGALLLVSKLDRLSRSVEMIANLMNNKRFATVEDGLGVSPMQLHIKAMVAENERKVIGERTKAALDVRKAQGKKLGGERGGDRLDKSRAVVSAEADAFAQRIAPVVMRMRRDNMTVHQIAAELNAQGNRTPRGHEGKWHGCTVNRIIKRIERLKSQG